MSFVKEFRIIEDLGIFFDFTLTTPAPPLDQVGQGQGQQLDKIMIMK